MPILNKCFSFLAGLHLAIFSLSTFNMLRDGLMLTQQRDIRPVHCEIRIPKAKRRIGTSRVRHQGLQDTKWRIGARIRDEERGVRDEERGARGEEGAARRRGGRSERRRSSTRRGARSERRGARSAERGVRGEERGARSEKQGGSS